MKNIKFSRLFAAMVFVAVLSFAGCKQQPEETKASIYGTWAASAYEKYTITETSFASLNGYEGDNLKIVEDDETSGRIFIKYTKSYEQTYDEPSDTATWTIAEYDYEGTHYKYWWRYSTTAPDVGKWYAIYYFDLTNDSVKLSAASNFENHGVSSCNTLDEAKTEFTLEKGYMSKAANHYSACTKE